MVSLYPYVSSNVRLEFCQFFEHCMANLADIDLGFVVKLFCLLLNDEDTCVKLQALESFDNLSHTCPNESFLTSVALAIKNEHSEVFKTLAAYLSREVCQSFVGFDDLDESLVALCSTSERKHICRQKSWDDRDQKLPKLEVDVESSSADWEDTEKLAERICDVLEVVSRDRRQLSRDTSDRLRQACRQFMETFKNGEIGR